MFKKYLKIVFFTHVTSLCASEPAEFPESQQYYKGSYLGILPADIFKSIQPYRIKAQIEHVLAPADITLDNALKNLSELERQPENDQFFGNSSFIEDLLITLYKRFKESPFAIAKKPTASDAFLDWSKVVWPKYLALTMAIKERKLKEVQKLINEGLKIDMPDTIGSTPLHLGASLGLLNIVQYLLEKGADIRARDLQGRTPLIAAAANGNINVIKYLLEKGADSNEQDLKGNTPLNYAILRNNHDAINLLRAHTRK